ncbi:hypothetical protein C1Y63_11455 [Corynebacterium sp. 13CS0277]|uniref:permease n=1 Tax=Corynebacterium sp. 13CS0277 TaxID=2071994 RepID=UPI000D02786B|nr:permease [Corynebacterium sp. 13CS0277]PRQ10451.1 hypothetical protein C1Y63_11455 [Corynebacterium sp. 13CS0277]
MTPLHITGPPAAPQDAHRRSSAPLTPTRSRHRGSPGVPRWAWLLGGILLVLLVWAQSRTAPLVPLRGTLSAWAVVMIAIVVQSLPFLVLGVLVSASISTLLPAHILQRILPRHPLWRVPAVSLAAVALPGCECSAVPVARSLMHRGVSPAAALGFMLASPSLNPVVIVSTAVAFADLPQMAWARFAAAFLAVVVAGWLWLIVGDDRLVRGAHEAGAPGGTVSCGCGPAGDTTPRRVRFVRAATADLYQAGGFLVVGAMLAASVKVLVPARWFVELAQQPWLAILLLAVLAIVLALCSEADAFVAASFTAVSPTAQLVFLVVGPVLDIKLMAMQVGTFGARFTWRFLSLVGVSALLCATCVGVIVFGAW